VIETKQAARLRWRREGRARAVSKDRKRWAEGFFAEGDGMTKTKAEDKAFELALEKYPPLSPLPRQRAKQRTEPLVESPSGAAWGNWEHEIGGCDVPASWGDLPESAPFDAEVEWVHQNMVLVIEERGTKTPLFHWDRAQKAAPSHGARNLMQFAASNRAGFMNMLQRVKPGAGGEEDIVRREKVKIEEIERILEELRESKSDVHRS